MSKNSVTQNALTDGLHRRHTYLRVSVTDRCNLRCVYCMPQTGVEWRERDELLTLEELYRVIALLANSGISKVRFTGGEPLVRKNIEWLIEQVAKLPQIETLAITTNGILLNEKMQRLVEAGITAVNISLDTLQSDRFMQITRFDRLSEVRAGINAALQIESLRVKINTVVIAGSNDDELIDFITEFGDSNIELRFIEYMPFRGTTWHPSRVITSNEMIERISRRYELTPFPSRSSSDTAQRYRIAGKKLTLGFIAPLSNHFCEHCNRLRLTADGSIKSCLFHPAENNLREAIRNGATDEDLLRVVQLSLVAKQANHQQTIQINGNRAMFDTGG